VVDSGSLYFFFLTAGIALAQAWWFRQALKRGHPRVLLIDTCLACLVGAIVGSRVLYVATEPLPAYALAATEVADLRARADGALDDPELSAALQEALREPVVSAPWLFIANMPPGAARSEAIARAKEDPTLVPSRLWFRAYPWDALAFWKGGLVYLGGVGLSVVLCVLVIRRHQGPVGELADISAPAIQLGSAIGRLGCLSTGCCYGAVCDPHWWSTTPSWLVGVLGDAPRYPTAAMLFTLSAAAFVGLKVLLARRAFVGEVFLANFVVYGVGRFVIEALRADPRGRWIGGLTTSQLIALATGLPCLALWVVLRRRARRVPSPTESQTEP
jgi:phosphatidylglycerol:prolipoprotein diacylglycerol transferase